MATTLTEQVRNIAQVTTAVANGDLSKKITVDVRGEIARAQEHDQHDGRPALLVRRRGHARRARGRHRGKPRRPGRGARASPAPGGPDREREHAGRRTSPTRCATSPTSTTAVANGDLTQKITVDASGEMLQLKNTINTMVDQLCSLRGRGHARRARGRHRGQARRPGAGRRRQRHLEGPDRHRERHGLEPHRPGAQHRRASRPRSRTATSRRRSPSTCAARCSS